ncbi:hypothetical protein ACOMHN_032595 [Nucella lapillus]
MSEESNNCNIALEAEALIKAGELTSPWEDYDYACTEEDLLQDMSNSSSNSSNAESAQRVTTYQKMLLHHEAAGTLAEYRVKERARNKKHRVGSTEEERRHKNRLHVLRQARYRERCREKKEKGTAGGARGKPKGTTGGAREKPKGTAGGAREKPKGTAEGVWKKPKGTTGGAQEKPKGTTGSAREKPKGTTGGMRGKPKGTMGGAREKLKGTTGGAREKPKGTTGGAREKPKAKEQVKKKFSQPTIKDAKRASRAAYMRMWRRKITEKRNVEKLHAEMMSGNEGGGVDIQEYVEMYTSDKPPADANSKRSETLLPVFLSFCDTFASVVF